MPNNLAEFRGHLGLTKRAMAETLSMNEGNYGKMERGEVKITPSTKLKFIEKFPHINFYWWANDDGPMLYKDDMKKYSQKLNKIRELQSSESQPNELGYYLKPHNYIAFYNVDSLKHGFDRQMPIQYSLDPALTGCDLVIKAAVDLKSTDINAGDWIGVRKLNDWKEFIQPGLPYLIITGDFELLRFVDIVTTDKITMRSGDQTNRTVELNKDLILELWVVKMAIPAPAIKRFN